VFLRASFVVGAWQRQLLDAAAPMALRLAALQASASLMVVCTTQEMLNPFFTAFSLPVRPPPFIYLLFKINKMNSDINVA
jgi:hypothetical protein